MFSYVKAPMAPPDMLKSDNASSRMAKYKITAQNTVSFLYSSDEQTEVNSKTQNPVYSCLRKQNTNE